MKLLIGGSPCTYWLPVSGYEGAYDVSTNGEIRNAKTGKILKQKIERNGYCRVHLSRNGKAKSILVHRIVANAFAPNPHGHKTVNHIDENKQNNKADNLEWCDMSYQNRYGNGAIARNKAKEIPVIQYSKSGEFVARFDSIKKAALALELNESSIACVCRQKRRYKSTGGYVFRFESEVMQND